MIWYGNSRVCLIKTGKSDGYRGPVLSDVRRAQDMLGARYSEIDRCAAHPTKTFGYFVPPSKI